MNKAYLAAVYSQALEQAKRRAGRMQGLEDAVNEIYTQWLTRPVKYPEPQKAALFIVREALSCLAGKRKTGRVGRIIGADTRCLDNDDAVTACTPDFNEFCAPSWHEVLMKLRSSGWAARMVAEAVGRKTSVVYFWERRTALPPEEVQRKLEALAGKAPPRHRRRCKMVKPTSCAVEFMALLQQLLDRGQTRNRIGKRLGCCPKNLDEWLHGAPPRPTPVMLVKLREIAAGLRSFTPMTDVQWRRLLRLCVTNKRERLHRAEIDLIRGALASGSWTRPARVSRSIQVKYAIWRQSGRWAHIVAAIEEPS